MLQPKTNNLPDFLSLMRIDQWMKNLFVFIPMFFNKQFLSLENMLSACLAFFLFSLIASSIYCFNDLIDLELDRKHEQKKNRSIANNRVSKKGAVKCMIMLASGSFILSYIFGSIELVFVLLTYFILNLVYTVLLKNIIILDAVIIAISFLLRIFAGSTATNTSLSYWIIVMVFLLALFLTFAKRRDESIIYTETNIKVRKNISKYSLKLLNVILVLLALSIIFLYIKYSLSQDIMKQFDNNYVYITSIFVVLGILRYLNLMKKRINYANPTKILLSDYLIQFAVLGWVISFFIIIYM